MKRNFLKDHKCWSITSIEKKITIQPPVGRYSKPAKPIIKAFETAEKCEKEAKKLITAKLKAGYAEVLLDIPNVNIRSLHEVEIAKKNKAKSLNVNIDKSEALFIEICTITSLEKLTISGVKSVPKEINQLKELDSLEIKGESLKKLPPEIGSFSKLRRFTIEYTGLASLPDEIGNLSSLKKLYIQHNQKLLSLPKTIGNLKKLDNLWINWNRNRHSSNALTNALIIPKELGELSELNELNLKSNNLNTLPDELASLNSLTELDLGFNEFKTIPQCILKLQNLAELDMHSSYLESIPDEFCDLENLVDFDCEFDKLKGFPKEVIENGLDAIQEFLQEKKYGTKAVVKTVDSPPKNFKELLEQRKENIDQFIREVKDRIYEDISEARFKELLDFLHGTSNTVPKSFKNDVYYFQSITSLLYPFEKWNFIDHRIVSYITQAAYFYSKGQFINSDSVRYDGYYEAFSQWLYKQLEVSSESDFYQRILKYLVKEGLTEDVILEGFLDNVSKLPLLSKQEKITSFGKYILEQYKKNEKTTLELILRHSHSNNFVALLLQEDEKLLNPIIDKVLPIKEYKGADGNKHLPYTILETLCKFDPKKYAPRVLGLIEQIDCVSCKAIAMRILFDYVGEPYKKLTWDFVTETLKYISEQHNTQSRYTFSWFMVNKFYEDSTAEYIEWIGQRFGKKALPNIFEYVENTKRLNLDVVRVVVKLYGQDAIDIAGEALKMKISDNNIAGHYKQAFNIISSLDYSKYYEKTWEVAQSEFKDVRLVACTALSMLDPKIIIPKAGELITSKQTHLREAGIFILSLLDSPKTLTLLKPILETEKNETNRNIAVQKIYAKPKNLKQDELHKRIELAKKRKKLEKPIVKWLDENKLPDLFWKDKQKPLSNEEKRFLFYRQKSWGTVIEKDPEASDVYDLIDKAKSEKFSFELLKLIRNNGGMKSTNRFALTLVGIFGYSDKVIETLKNEAIKYQNINACSTLGLIISLDSARALDQIIQTYRIKYPNVNSAARDAFENIADQMGLTIFELSDKMIPNLDFENLEKPIIVGNETYRAIIDHNLKMVFYNPLGKLIKSISKASKQQKETLKEENKTLREIIRQLTINMEHYLVTQRKWGKKDWEIFFLGNPIAFAFAQNFVWQILDSDNIKESFIVLPDQTFENHQKKKIKLTAKNRIQIAHPIHLQETEYWQKHFESNSFKPPFQQLDRLVTNVDKTDKKRKLSFMFENKRGLAGSTFKSRAEKKGWKRGSVIDSGAISAYRKPFPNENIEVFIKLEGTGVGYYDDESIELKEFMFVPLGSVQIGSYVYDEPRDEKDNRLITFEDVPPIVYSETLNDLNFVTAQKV